MMRSSNRIFSSLLSFPSTIRPSLYQCRPTQFPLRLKIVRTFNKSSRFANSPADSQGWTSPLDNPPILVRANRRHNAGLLVLAIIPVSAFCLGTWQVNRLKWKTDLIAKYEDRLIRDPLPLPPHIDPSAIADFDYRRVTATGRFRHDQEMLIGPRLHDGHDGFLVVTPLERRNGSTILVNRGWISKAKASQAARAAGAEALPRGDVVVLGMLRKPWRRNAFTPANDPARGKWYFPDVQEMAAACGAEPVWVEEVMNMELVEAYRREEAGIPIGRPPEVNLRNNHAQYIFTWYALSAATAVMFYMVAKTPRGGRQMTARRNVSW